MSLTVLKALAALLSSIPGLLRLAAEVQRIVREREAAQDRKAKDERNDAAIREAQKALDKKEAKP